MTFFGGEENDRFDSKRLNFFSLFFHRCKFGNKIVFQSPGCLEVFREEVTVVFKCHLGKTLLKVSLSMKKKCLKTLVCSFRKKPLKLPREIFTLGEKKLC